MSETHRFAFVFPGQGSQSVGMLGDLFKFDVIRKIFDQASYVLGEDLLDLVLTGPADKLNQTIYTQPIMLVSAYAIYRLWRDQGGWEPYAVAGHSLGEYTALVVAGVLDFESAVDCVRFRAQVMQNALPAGEGIMAAIIGLDPSVLSEICNEISASDGVVEMVNFNAPNQIVIAGLRMAVEKACEKSKAAGAKRALVLPVSAPFHSSLLANAARELEKYFSTIVFHKPRLYVINNVDAVHLDEIEGIKNALVCQAYHPVRWIECIQALARLFCESIIECGPGKVLTGLTKRIVPNHLALNLSKFSDIGDLQELLQENSGDKC